MVAGQSGKIAGCEGLNGGVGVETGPIERIKGRGVLLADFRGVFLVLLEQKHPRGVESQLCVGRCGQNRLQRGTQTRPVGRKPDVSPLATGRVVVPCVQGRPLEPFAGAHDDGGHPRAHRNPVFEPANHRFEVQFGQIRPNHRNIGASGQVNGPKRVPRARMGVFERIHPRFELLAGHPVGALDHHVRRRGVLKELRNVVNGLTV